MLATPLITSLADELVFTHGRLDPLQLLVAAGLLDEDDRRGWLSGGRAELESRLRCTPEEAAGVLERVRAHLRAQGLTAQRVVPLDPAAERRVGSSPELAELCSICLVPSGPQLDLFQDSAAVAAENAVRAALAEGRLKAANEGLALMTSLGAPPAATGGYRQLIEATERVGGDAVDRIRELDDLLAPLASRCLGHYAFAYLVARWRAVARRLDGMPFSPEAPTVHSSYADLRAAQWRNVIDGVEREAGWQRHAVLVTRLAEAYARSANRPAARRVWALLCWTHPEAAGEAFGAACADPLLARRWQEFSDAEPELPPQDFPTWLLLADPAQRGFVPASQASATPAGAAYAAMYRLVASRDDIAARKELKAYDAGLLRHYLAYRDGRRR